MKKIVLVLLIAFCNADTISDKEKEYTMRRAFLYSSCKNNCMVQMNICIAKRDFNFKLCDSTAKQCVDKCLDDCSHDRDDCFLPKF